MMRECGDCHVCCDVAQIPHVDGTVKPAHSTCKYLKPDPCGSCTVYGKKEKPEVCSSFDCGWLIGLGGDDDRPNKIGAMFFMNDIGGGIFGAAIETEKDAIRTTARDMAAKFARAVAFPVIVVAHDEVPPDDTGTWVVVKDSLVDRTKMMRGPLVEMLADDVGLYELVEASRWPHSQ